MSTRKHLYPDDWNEIATAIKDAAGWKCEQCGAPHNEYIIRSEVDPFRWAMDDPETTGCLTWSGELYKWSEAPMEYCGNVMVKVILTVHHIGVEKEDGAPGDPEDKMDCREENLIALCQRCHLLADMPENLPKRKFTRLEHKRQAQVDAGQGELF